MARILERRNDVTGRVSLDIPVELRDTHFEDSFEADCVNLSTGGLSLRSPCLPDVGATLECRLASADGATVVVARGEVVWAQLDGERSGEFGLRFVDAGADTECAIEQLLEHYCAPASGDAPGAGSSAVVHLELEGTAEAITAELARDGRGTATFEQKLDLLQLGRAIRARQLHGKDRHGEIAAVELKLVGNTPMLAVTVDFEEREYGEFDAFSDDACEQDPEHDTAPDLATPAHDTAAPPVAPLTADRFSHTTETEFARPRSAPPVLAEAARAEPVVATEASEAGLPAALADSDPFEAAMFRSSVGGDAHAATPAARDRADVGRSDREESRQDPRPEADASVHRAERGPTPEEPDSRPEPARAAAPRSMPTARAPEEEGHDAWRRAADEADEPGLILEPPPLLARARVLVRRVVPPFVRAVTALGGVVLAAAGRGLPRMRGMAIRLRGVLGALYRERLATGVGAARRLIAPRLPRRRRRTTAVPVSRARARMTPSLPARPLAMAVMGVAAVGLGAYALMPGASDEPLLHRAVEPAKAPPERASAEAAIALAPAPQAVSDTAAAPPAPTPVAAEAPPPPPVATTGGVVFGQAQVPDAKLFTLRMSARVEALKGIPDAGGFTVIIPGSLSLDRAGPISAAHGAVRRSMILNKGDRSELTIRFAEGKKPRYQVRAAGNQLEIRIQDV